MLIRIDPTSDQPLFEQVAASVRADAAAGRLRAGDRLPAAREVAPALGVNLHTVLRAYQELRDEGLVDMRRGRGAVLTAAVEPLAALHDDIAALVTRARSLGLSPDTLASLIKETSA
ncbi:GntR family transcriptional regulator [Microbacterium thalassium]|uniref:GntR family transcriptional regulator n=1 Tax=Microbacterium thalassium TaxID=362649 RepID=A0A7X0FRL5_9MICO|nr:GntR family transcriptional regulator [Microbacterium thalassium]MBB6392409.1 GntR family transcriptional regulator [Microbacterium thalassium]GLK25058.1 GntR family transcriptional regulator [Microbacterium thalassium]